MEHLMTIRISTEHSCIALSGSKLIQFEKKQNLHFISESAVLKYTTVINFICSDLVL